MSKPTKKVRIKPKSRPLKLTQQVMIKALTDPNSPTFGNAKRSYMKAHPNAAESTAGVEAYRTLDNPRVAAEARKRLSLEDMEDLLEWCASKAKDDANLKEVRSAVMDLAALTGKLISKSEVRTVGEEHKTALHDMLRSALRTSDNVDSVSPKPATVPESDTSSQDN